MVTEWNTKIHGDIQRKRIYPVGPYISTLVCNALGKT